MKKNRKMKKKLHYSFVSYRLFFGCKPKETITVQNWIIRPEAAIKGNWRIASFNFPGSEYLKVTSLTLRMQSVLKEVSGVLFLIITKEIYF